LPLDNLIINFRGNYSSKYPIFSFTGLSFPETCDFYREKGLIHKLTAPITTATKFYYIYLHEKPEGSYTQL